MSKLSKIIAPAIIAATALGVTLPAQAADYGRNPQSYQNARHNDAARYTPVRNDNVRGEIAQLRRQIDRAAANRTISPREANGLRRDARDLERQYATLARNGLTRAEARMIENRVDRIKVALRSERRDSDRRRG